jgi:DNA-binding NarL/FixJ family response regulator
MAEVITVAAIDDDRMLLQGMAAWLSPVTDITLVASVTSVAEFERSDLEVDVALLDLNLRNGSHPADNVRALLDRGSRVLVMSVIPDTEHVIATIEAGASGYVTKSNDLDALTAAIREVAAGGSPITPELAFALSRDMRPRRPGLSPKERSVLTHYAAGMTLEAVARRMDIKPGTVREYLARIKRKYEAVGRPAYTKLELAQRLREDRLELDQLPD